MPELDIERHRPRMRVGRGKRLVRMVGAISMFFREVLLDDLALLWKHARLFTGMVLVLVGVLSFASDRYCDGNTSTYYTCTRPATYYYYPWWAVVLVVLGACGVTLWFLRKKTR